MNLWGLYPLSLPIVAWLLTLIASVGIFLDAGLQMSWVVDYLLSLVDLEW